MNGEAQPEDGVKHARSPAIATTGDQIDPPHRSQKHSAGIDQR